MIVRESLRAAAESLEATSESPRLDAELLMAHALNVSRESMLLDYLDGETPPSFKPFLERRMGHEPVAYITGYREFWSLEFSVGPGVLIPRPDSETLIEVARTTLSANPPNQILDLGTGSGALLLAALSEWPMAKGVGIDRSATALACAESNAERLGLSGRAQFRIGDWGENETERYDLILCNPPYVAASTPLMPDVGRYEPQEALFALDEGLADYRRIVPQLSKLLSTEGVACLELGEGQAASVSQLCAEQALVSSISRDLAGHERCLLIHS